jgi:hypothetical protein
MCGSHYTEKEAGTDEAIEAKFKGQTTKPMIITGKSKKRYYDKSGNLITVPDIIDLIKTGANLISYREQKSGENKIVNTDKERRGLLRRQDR